MIDTLVASTGNPNDATIDEIVRDAMACANSGISNAGNIVKAGAHMYNAVGQMFNPQSQPQQFQGYPQMNYIPQQGMPMQYPYAETGFGTNMSFVMNMNPTSQWSLGYPGFADPDYGMIPQNSGNGFFGGRL